MSLFKSKPDAITSFEIVTLHLSGMRGMQEYEIVMKDGQAEVSLYFIRFVQSEDQRELALRGVCPEERMLKLLNDCRMMSWNGFNGPHPKWVLDGTQFRLTATVNGGKPIHASGSENFPKGYYEFERGLYEILNNKEPT
ncbi:MAG: hypothetical protein IKI63_01225 [Clostridia bacterium]|nr:hypothetical protein [Clostridia bacterium]